MSGRGLVGWQGRVLHDERELDALYMNVFARCAFRRWSYGLRESCAPEAKQVGNVDAVEVSDDLRAHVTSRGTQTRAIRGASRDQCQSQLRQAPRRPPASCQRRPASGSKTTASGRSLAPMCRRTMHASCEERVIRLRAGQDQASDLSNAKLRPLWMYSMLTCSTLSRIVAHCICSCAVCCSPLHLLMCCVL